MTTRPLPDAEELATAYLRGVSDVTTAAVGGIHTEVPKNPTWPLLVVRRIGGRPRDRRWVDAPRLQIDAWADVGEKKAAHDLAAIARAALQDMAGIYDQGIVTGVDDDLALTWQPDPVTSRARYLFGIVAYTHPLPA